ncbi:hypothetical protein DV737_g4883, partial [Chaetothyriales sp. CBS 132003]
MSRQQNKEEVQSVTGPVVDCMGEISPWAQSLVERKGEKRLHSGHRRRDADEAWEHEHKTEFCSSTDDDHPSTQSRSGGPRFGEVMSVAAITSMHSRPRRHHQPSRSQYDSQDSLDSIVPKVTSVSGRRARKPDYCFDAPDSGYGSRGSRSHRSHGSRAGSYAYSTSPQSHIYQPSGPSGKAAYAYPSRHHGIEQAPIALPRYSTY